MKLSPLGEIFVQRWGLGSNFRNFKLQNHEKCGHKDTRCPLKKAPSEYRYANKDFEPIIIPVIRSGFRSASGFDIVFAEL